MRDVETAVLESIRELFPEQGLKIGPDMTLEELSLDSLEMLELKMRIEEKLDIELEVSAFEGAPTLHSIVDHIVISLQRPS